MCGIAGLAKFTEITVEDIESVKRMTSKLIHRGPDSDGFYNDEIVSLGFRRLKIIDLQTGDQPISNKDETIWTCLNGEIYNYKTLRHELIKIGYQFKTNSDTEVIVHAYQQYGLEFVSKLKGMFAIVLWDIRKKKLLLVRDRLGKKPLFYCHLNDSVFFSSGIKSLLENRQISKELNFSALNDYLSLQCIPAPQTIFRNVKKLPPGSILVADYQNNSVEIKKYWQLEYSPKIKISFKDAQEELINKVRDAVKIRMVSDVPIGALLSGGIDSSIVVGLMSNISKDPVHTFSIGFDDEKYDESIYANQIAQSFGTVHKQLTVRPNAIDVVPKIVEMLDEPMADSSAVPTYYVSKISKEFVTVVLNGDGGDEVFSGYDRYGSALRLSRLLKIPGIIKDSIGFMDSFIPKKMKNNKIFSKFKTLNDIKDLSFNQHFIRQTLLWQEHERVELIKNDICEKIMVDDINSAEKGILKYLERDNKLDSIDKMLIADVNGYLPNDLLVKMDRMSMAHSLEARSPFLDHELMEFVAKLPSNYKRKLNNGKILLKSAFKDLLPKNIMKRKKQGFGVPINQWIKGELKEMVFDALLSPSSNSLNYFNKSVIEKILIDHNANKRDYASKIWSLLIFEIWCKKYL